MKFQCTNPYLGECLYIPDGEPHVYGERIYVYGSHDYFGSMRYCPGDYHVFSSNLDFSDSWKDEGVTYKRKNIHNKSGFHCLWAPDCIYKNGKYYLYFCYEWQNYIMVAVSDKPSGPFKYIGDIKHKDGTLYGHKETDIMCFDPGAFVDDDGRVFIYTGYSCNEELKKMLKWKGIHNCDGTGNQVIELEEDMLTIKGEPKRLIPGYKNSAGTSFVGHEMYEASSMRKFNGKYYFIYSSRLSHELAYAMSDYPDHGFEFKGALISNGDIGYKGNKEPVTYYGNVHGSVEKIGDKYYVFYHRQTNYNEQSRQGCAEEITMNADGTFNMAEVTSQGLNGKPLLGEGTYKTYVACNLMSDKGATKCQYGPFARHKYKLHPAISEKKIDGQRHQLIINMRNNAVAGFKYFKLEHLKEITIKVRGSAGKIILSNSLRGMPLSETTIDKSKTFKEYKLKINDLSHEKCPLYFTYIGQGKIDFLEFTLNK